MSAYEKMVAIVTAQVASAAKFGPFVDPHHAYGILCEEVREFFDEVCEKDHHSIRLRNEALDVATVMLRYATQLEEVWEKRGKEREKCSIQGRPDCRIEEGDCPGCGLKVLVGYELDQFGWKIEVPRKWVGRFPSEREFESDSDYRKRLYSSLDGSVYLDVPGCLGCDGAIQASIEKADAESLGMGIQYPGVAEPRRVYGPLEFDETETGHADFARGTSLIDTLIGNGKCPEDVLSEVIEFARICRTSTIPSRATDGKELLEILGVGE